MSELNKITISIISHSQGELVKKLLKSIEKSKTSSIDTIILTNNIYEEYSLKDINLPCKLIQINNSKIKGFGENHNYAFKSCKTDYFCCLNPDITFLEDPFPDLLKAFNDNKIAMISPKIVNEDLLTEEDSIRNFPTPFLLIKKFFFNSKGTSNLNIKDNLVFPDWIAGMFILFKSSHYKELNGFDENFFLYYEDVDLCLRAWRKNLKVANIRSIKVIHNARRDSHKKLKYMKYHLSSIFKFFFKHLGRFPR
tara:strand:- start:4693 stop:5448 length:756 start_codon:yes stop_codon:yes gene_type:complete